MRKGLVIFLVVLSVFLAAGCAEDNGQEAVTPEEMPTETPIEEPEEVPEEVPEEGETVEVTIADFAFDPDSVTISSGDTVRWTNMDPTTHTVDGPTFSSGNLNEGDTFEFTFTEPGTYDYQCSIHPTMEGVVIVE